MIIQNTIRAVAYISRVLSHVFYLTYSISRIPFHVFHLTYSIHVFYLTYSNCFVIVYMYFVSDLFAVVSQSIKFTHSLDLFEYCTPELQQKLTPMRLKMKEEEDRQLEALNQVS